ncbi:MAG: methionyl-tRNA formyltransferase [Planctomycetes bacterium RBG_16_55_9]|nr:MAG: methionyl-tRNA formyltransferase [Planctomycetes bacterium RBG_16_55_9]
MIGSEHELRLVVTQPAQPAGRGRKPNTTPVAHWAGAHGVPFIETQNANEPSIIEQIASCQPELIVVIAFGQKISNELIALPPKGAINVHASLLPKYRGAAPINWAIIKGETATGVSIITLAEKMDTGKILAQAQTDIGPRETAAQLHDRLAEMAGPLLLNTINQIADGTAIYTEQDHSKATAAPKLKKEDGRLDFSEPAEVLARKIRGFWPWPGASASYLSRKSNKSVRVTIAGAEVVETSNPANLPTGTLDEDLNVICGEDALKITQIKPAGSALMAFKDFANGRQTQPGDSFVKIDS